MSNSSDEIETILRRLDYETENDNVVINQLRLSLNWLQSLKSTSSVVISTPITPIHPSPFSTLLLTHKDAALPTVLASTFSANVIEWLTSTLPSPSLLASVIDIVSSSKDDNAVVESLLDVYGYERIEIVGEVVQQRRAIVIASQLVPPPPLPSVVVPPTRTTGGERRVNHDSNGHAGTRGVEQRLPQAQIRFQTLDQLQQAKRDKKLRKGKGKDYDEYEDREEEIDFEEWERIREQSLLDGPSVTFSNRVRFVHLCSFLFRGEVIDVLHVRGYRYATKSRSSILMFIYRPLRIRLRI